MSIINKIAVFSILLTLCLSISDASAAGGGLILDEKPADLGGLVSLFKAVCVATTGDYENAASVIKSSRQKWIAMPPAGTPGRLRSQQWGYTDGTVKYVAAVIEAEYREYPKPVTDCLVGGNATDEMVNSYIRDINVVPVPAKPSAGQRVYKYKYNNNLVQILTRSAGGGLYLIHLMDVPDDLIDAWPVDEHECGDQCDED